MARGTPRGTRGKRGRKIETRTPLTPALSRGGERENRTENSANSPSSPLEGEDRGEGEKEVNTEDKRRARQLRRDATHAEKELWRRLRNRKLAGIKFRRQQPLGSYVLDFFCAEKKLNVEVDGGQHDLPENRNHDERRAVFLKEQGVKTLRFWNSQIRENMPAVLERIRAELVDAPHLGPLPRRVEGENLRKSR